jgi:hypothetical protein
MWNRADPTEWQEDEIAEKRGIENFESSLFSQNGEDGILRYLFSEIGFRSRLFLEFGFGVIENNSLSLILKENFGGVFIDGYDLPVIEFNEAAQSFGLFNVVAINTFLTLENLEATIIGSNLPEEIDLLSIDIDGNDYWLWEGLNSLSPRVVVIEYNASLGPDLSLSVPYDPEFDRYQKHPSGFYYGASITALEKLGKKKGYRLIGCDSNGINAFFVREDCATKNTVKVVPHQAWRPHKRRIEDHFSTEEQYGVIKDLVFVHIH